MHKKNIKIIGLIVIILLIGLVGSFFLLNDYIYQEKQANDKSSEPYRASLEGIYDCLPYKENTITPVESECEPAIKTNNDEYYAVNFYLMSQTHAPLVKNQRFSANGSVTPIERLSTDHWRKYNVVGIFSVTDSLVLLDDEGEQYACTLEAKLCEDGSYVGRQGPKCEFSKCPPSSVSLPTEVNSSLGENTVVLDLTISPKEVVSDSRCPSDVVCIWAGTVEVRTNLSTPVSHGEHVLTLGKPQVFGKYSVTLIEVLPKKTQEAVKNNLYKFKYLVSLK